MNNNALIRRYALKSPTKPAVNRGGAFVHGIVHHAMLSAANETGLIPHDRSGQEQYQTFAKYRDMAHGELNDLNSPFTKLFNRHKSQIGEVLNPKEHIKNALVPLFKYLAHHENSEYTPAIPIEHEHEGESIDLLSGEHHPLEESGGNFEYQPRLPSGFVELPPKSKRVIKNPALPHNQRQGVYQTIAHALANREDVHQALSQEHGFDQATASKHYNNFLKAKKKPQGKIRPENQIPLPRKGGTGRGGVRRRKFDRTDLMAIPVRYSKVPNTDCHEIILDNDNPIEEEPVKKQAFRAPAKGVIIRGTQYKGGELLPDMQGKFVNPRRRTNKPI